MMAPKWYTPAQQRDHDMKLGWIDAMRGLTPHQGMSEHYHEGYRHYVETKLPLRKPPTLTQQFSQLGRTRG
jgi:hypothetical protein